MSGCEKLNRSYSESDLGRSNNKKYEDAYDSLQRDVPYVKTTIMIIEEIYRSPPVFSRGHSISGRFCSLDSLYRKPAAPSNFNAIDSDIKLNTYLHPDFSDINSRSSNHNEMTPMDVDFEERLDAVQQMDVSIPHRNNQTKKLNNKDVVLKMRKPRRKRNKKHVILPEEPLQSNTVTLPKRGKSTCSNCFVFILICLLLFCVWALKDLVFVNHDVQVQNLRKTLLENVHEQKGPVNVIIKSFESRSHWPDKIKVLGFIGSSGVGKTFATNIIKKCFAPGLVHELYGFQNNYKERWGQILNNLKSCCLNLVIVDDLYKKDVRDLFALVRSLPKDYYILVISIFSIQYSDSDLNYSIDYNDINEIRLEFDNSGLFHELAVFRQLDIGQVRDWLGKQLKVQNINYDDTLLSNILHNHSIIYEGLKGLQSKLLLEREKLD